MPCFKLYRLYLQVNHVSWKRDLWILPCIYNRYVRLFDFLLNKSLKRKKKTSEMKKKSRNKQAKKKKCVFINVFSPNLIKTHDVVCQQWFLAYYVSNADSITHSVCGPSPHSDEPHSQTSSGMRWHLGSTAIQRKKK